ncbi:hypothetical protein Afil01_63360 [Actinorhabdospora filicis]|uniref:Transglycosylase SLT domain-containing protein n=2 Tax=Actinorhabdospora filicis TaxID=1785913 RepID=A0A9W6WCD3_9ACTN|nr:hypothetical protein Afil01_63360 [Actinorhabdospora filicis]
MLVFVAAIALLTACSPPGADPAAPTPSPSDSWELKPLAGKYDPAEMADSVRTRSAEAGVNPVLVMAILYNESYKPHDPDLERAWLKYDPDSSLGIANMHEAAFEDVKRDRPFADRSWQELPDDRDLAVRAAAWYLHDLSASLPGDVSGAYTRDELLALGYNAGPGNMRAYADGGQPASSVRGYLEKLRANWGKATEAVG